MKDSIHDTPTPTIKTRSVLMLVQCHTQTWKTEEEANPKWFMKALTIPFVRFRHVRQSLTTLLF